MKSQKATEIVQKLRAAGHTAYFVGGCVRDLVMGIEPQDYDIATSARPEEVQALFPRTEAIGARFGVVLVILGGHPFEVATFRSDEAYVDGRRPSGVVFTTAEDDVLRRDFTINGMLYDPIEDRLIDYVGGRRDIEARIVRAIGDPYARFAEDKLRILRAVRFGARLGYSIEPRTWEAVCAMAGRINQVSRERIRDELVRILTEGQAASGVRLLKDSGLLAQILPEVAWSEDLDRMLQQLKPRHSPALALAVLLHACDPADVVRIVRRLRSSNAEGMQVVSLVRRQHDFETAPQMSVSDLKRFLRLPRFDDHLELSRIRVAAGTSTGEALRLIERRLGEWTGEDIQPAPLISGADLISLGITPGPAFSRILAAVEDAQLDGRLESREAALAFIRDRFRTAR